MSKKAQDSHLYFFAYGSLKQDYFFGHLMKDHQFIGESYLVGSFIMFVHPEGFPGIIPSMEAKKQIQGELYLLKDDSIISDLDILEGHPEEYTRSECQVSRSNSSIYDAFVYVYNASFVPTGGKIIQSAFYLEDKQDDERRRKIIEEHGLARFLSKA